MSLDRFLNQINFQITPPQVGVLLVSNPLLNDPNFYKSVILLTQYQSTGTMGLILNQISVIMVDQVIPDFSIKNIPIYIGGPVGRNHLFFIHTLGNKITGSRPIIGDLYLGGDLQELELLLKTKKATHNQVRFFMGYTGWDTGQLMDEIESSSWIVTPTTAQQVMLQSDNYWLEVMESLGKEYQILSRFPSNPSLN